MRGERRAGPAACPQQRSQTHAQAVDAAVVHALHSRTLQAAAHAAQCSDRLGPDLRAILTQAVHAVKSRALG